ncbi:hypothetical protein QTG54_006407 [Skeletonema marinoi]|uniref:Uncharacterized protein n=1 Tax=Skeletonema marinoi TaxID=267567 RepID=A0AAD8YC37_9STRA|nr:hypothetical protein QTG54_006407 [Skeletonema marinoi]
MKSVILILLSSPRSVVSFARHSRRQPPSAAVGPLKKEQQASLAYSFRQPDDDAAYSEESKSSILSNINDENNNNNMNGISSSTTDNDEMDIVGSGTLGDIMSGTPDATTQKTTKSSHPPLTTSNNSNNNNTPSSSSKVIDGLVTKEGGELNTRFNCNFSPMERIALTSNGNLQRIFSSYYDAPVHVHIDFCERRTLSSSNDVSNGDDGSLEMMDCTTTDVYKQFDRIQYPNQETNGENYNTNEAIWDRIVHIHIHGQTICKATSIISVKDPVCIRLIENGTIGLGQLFRYLNRLPTFSLVDAGRSSGIINSSASTLSSNKSDALFEGGIWRTYELKCEEMTCLIHEEFHKDAWNISPLDSSGPFQPMI